MKIFDCKVEMNCGNCERLSNGNRMCMFKHIFYEYANAIRVVRAACLAKQQQKNAHVKCYRTLLCHVSILLLAAHVINNWLFFSTLLAYYPSIFVTESVWCSVQKDAERVKWKRVGGFVSMYRSIVRLLPFSFYTNDYYCNYIEFRCEFATMFGNVVQVEWLLFRHSLRA